MEVSLEGYRFDRRVSHSGAGEVWEARRDTDAARLVARVYALELRPALVARVAHEFEQLRGLELPGIVPVVACEWSADALYLLSEAPEGTSLAEYAGGHPLPLDRFFAIATQLCAVLATVHARRVIHRDIRPSNVFVSAEGTEPRLGNFGISVLLEHGGALSEGLAYTSPEQTGRTGREVDYRSDLYALGVTFYELLTGELPFTASSSLELIHAHLARQPQPPQRLRPELPPPLARLLIKLLAKAPERRYQSARGLLHDLEHMGEALAEGKLRARFQLGTADIPSSIRLPHQLYGRERERAELRASVRRSLSEAPVFVLITGEAGLGKSALMAELAELSISYAGRLGRGRFEAGHDEPLHGLSRALDSLAEQLLTADDDELERLRERLIEVLGPLCAVICELAPRFAALFEHAPLPRGGLGLDTARNRLRQAVVRALETLAEPEHPLVLALDDVQWIDSATLDVLESLAASQRLGLCVVLAARPEALAEPRGVLRRLLARLEQRADARPKATRVPYLHLPLAPLDEEQIVELLADALALDWRELTSLAEVVHRKTGGNPYFTGQFLLHLGERELIRRGPSRWQWDLEALNQASLPEDALSMLTRKLRRLDAKVLELLLAASVLGTHVDPDALAQLTGLDELTPRLLYLVEEGLLRPAGDGGFRFVHGRAREAAYAMLEPGQRRAWHRALGELMLAAHEGGEHEGGEHEGLKLLETVEHLDRGSGLWPDSGELGADEASEVLPARLIELNLLAGQRALATGAPASARTFLGIAEALVGGRERALVEDPDLRKQQLDIQLSLAQAETFTDAQQAASERLLMLFSDQPSAHERARIGTVRCSSLMAQGEPDAALELGVELLGSFGIHLARAERPELHGRIEALLDGLELDALVPALDFDDPELAAVLELISVLSLAGELAAPPLFAQLVSQHVELLREHGAHPSLPVAFAQLALLAASRLGRYAAALELSERCVELAAGGPGERRVGLLHILLRLWSEPLVEVVDEVEGVFEGALALGDTGLAARSLLCECRLVLWAGLPLRLVEARITSRLRWVEQWGISGALGEVERVAQLCRRLVGGPLPSPGELDPLGWFEGPGVPVELELHQGLLLAVSGCWTSLYQRLAPLYAGAGLAGVSLWWSLHARGLWGLACAHEAGRELSEHREAARRELERLHAQLAGEVEAGAGAAALCALLEAELRVLEGELALASRGFTRAHGLAQAEKLPVYAALAAERHAEGLVELGHAELALGPLLQAYDSYAGWGAGAKLEQLRRRWPRLARLRPPELALEHGRGGESIGAGGAGAAALDAASLLKASQTLAEDLRYAEVIGRLMGIALENAGAQRCVLMLALKGKLSYAAEATVELGHEVFEQPPLLAGVGDRVPATLLRYVLRTSESIVLRAASEDGRFAADPYFRGLSGQARDGLSILCLPVIRRRRPIGLLYFENQLGTGVFTAQRLELLSLLAGHAGSALENARLYETLRDSEIRWRSLVDQLPDYVVLLRRDGSLEYINALARPQLRAAVHFDARRFISPEYGPEVAAAIARVFAGGGQVRLEVCVEIAPEERRWYVARVAPISIEGQVVRVLVVATDIDDRKQAEAARDGFEAQLRQQQRLDSIGTLASGVAHEINNPVQGIMNYAEIISSSPAADEMIREFAGEIGHETRRVATIVRNLLAFARQEYTEGGEQTTVEEVIEGTISLIAAILRRDEIELRVELPPGLPTLQCRRQQVQQVVMNLVTNARDALNARFREFHADKRIDIGGYAFEREGEAWVAISVRDWGGGIPADVVANIFDPFFTTKGRDQGTGLGLSVSHGIIADHAGHLRLDNRPGEGATFTIELPCAARFRERDPVDMF